jgi:uncharacterized membrane protein
MNILKKIDWALVVILSLAVFMSLGMIDRDIFVDEAFSYDMAKQPVNVIVGGNDVHPPLYYLLLKPFAELTGNIFYLRLTSLLFFIMFLALFYTYLSSKYSKIAVSTASVLIALSPSMNYFATELRMYSLLMFFAMMCICFLDEDYINQKGFFMLWFSMILMIYTHFMSFFFIGTIFVYLIMQYPEKIKKILGMGFWLTISVIPLASIMFTKILPQIETMWAKPPTLISLISSYTYLITPPFSRMGLFFLPIGALFIFMLFFRIKPEFAKNKLYYLILILPIVSIWLFGRFFSVFHHRYTLYCAIGLFALVCVYMQKLLDSEKEEWAVIVALAFAAIILSQSTLLPETTNQTLNNGAMFITNATAYTNLPLIHTSTFSYLPFKMYLPDREQYLKTNLTKKQLFTACGSLLQDKDFVSEMPKEYLLISDKPNGEVIYEESGFFITRNIGCHSCVQ